MAAAEPDTTPKAAPDKSNIGPLHGDPEPTSFDAGPLGPVAVTGAFSGFGLLQSDHVAPDRSSYLDISNALLIANSTEGPVQFYAQAGLYSIPSLAIPYLRGTRTDKAPYGPLPVAYLKLAPDDRLTITAGKLPTLIGAEPTFTFQNMTIERGLLWNEEPAVSRGIQADYTIGAVTMTASLNDGFYSDRYNWLIGAATWNFSADSSLIALASGNIDRTTVVTDNTPLAQNNGQIYELIYNGEFAPWSITAYGQILNIPRNAGLGIQHDAQTYGAALLVTYAFGDGFSLAGRSEVIGTTGSVANGAPNLLEGPGSSAWSLTLTPTYQQGRYFVRSEASFTKAEDITRGLAFGRSGGADSQTRLMLEAGLLF